MIDRLTDLTGRPYGRHAKTPALRRLGGAALTLPGRLALVAASSFTVGLLSAWTLL